MSRGRLKIDELFPDVQAFVFGSMRDVYSDVRQAWRELIIAHTNKSASSHHVLAALTHVIGE